MRKPYDIGKAVSDILWHRQTYIQLLLYRDIQSIHILGDKENLMYVVEVIFILQYLSKTSYIAQKA